MIFSVRQTFQSYILKIALTLQPALPRASATAFPMPLEAPVTITTGASTFCVVSTLACSAVATCAFTPASLITLNFKVFNLTLYKV
ncbi:hypothetical protein Hanom_Chr17g01529691 [Helianthus anomalus]